MLFKLQVKSDADLGLEMLVADPLFQIALECPLIGKAAKDHFADGESEYHNEGGKYPTSIQFPEGNQPDKHRYQGNGKSCQLSLHR
jgi:hypothetical protein